MEKIIGKGSYGYIFFPCLEFEDKLDIDVKKYVTKLQIYYDAENEMNNIKMINSIDKNSEFHLGEHYIVKLNKELYKNIIYNYNLEIFIDYNFKELTPILIKNGGYDLNYYSKIFKKWSYVHEEKIYLFLKEYYRLLQGIKLFNDNNIVHHDITPKNILYDVQNNRLNFIDFSLTNKKENIISLSKKSDYEYSIFHSSYPLELYFFNLDNFNMLINKSDIDIDNIFNKLYCYFIENEKSYKNKFFNKLIDSFSELFNYYYNLDNKVEKIEIMNNIIQNYKLSLLNLKKMNYDDFINSTLNTFDLYSYGLTFIYVLNYIQHIIKPDLFLKLMDLGIKMSFIDLSQRISIEESLLIFKNILEEYKILIN
jgi:serine/threonine protein kinase